MRRILFALLFMFPVLLQAQSEVKLATAMNGDVVLKVMDSAWHYKVADDIAMAAPDYNDSSWATIDPRMKGDSSFSMLHGVAWFRKHVYVPDSVWEMPLAINMSHY